MPNFFIRRPIVAIVISILTVMLGAITITRLSVEQYPFLAPPNIRVTATYPGASAEAVEQSVATPIEQEVNGVDRLIYMKSSNTSDGRCLLDVNLRSGQIRTWRTSSPRTGSHRPRHACLRKSLSRVSPSRSRVPAF